MTSMRQLAAIMFTDIVGYTALMGENETKALELLQTNRLLQRPLIEKYHGRWLKEIGDGVLASFNTVSDAVYCAIDIQKACKSDTDLNLRIGIHQGEVVFEGEDVFGDGVNIASRIESLAPAGCIYISESVLRNVENKKEINSEFVGEKVLKNVKHPVRIYQIKIEGQSNLRTLDDPIAIPKQDSEKSIAILPFVNMSNDPEQEYFCDGLSEELLNSFSQLDKFKVASRTSSFMFKGKDIDIEEIGQKLNVETVLEGSVRKSQNRIRITVQLINVGDGFHLWSERYDREMTDIFDIQDEIALAIVDALKLKLLGKEKASILKRGTENPEAYQLYLNGRQYFHLMTPKGYLKAIEFYNTAIKMEPAYSEAYAGLASCYLNLWHFDILPADKSLPHMIHATYKSIEIDNQNAEGHLAMARLKFWYEFDFKEAERELQKVFKFNPNIPDAIGLYSFLLSFLGKKREAFSFCKKATELDPFSPMVNVYFAWTHWLFEDYDGMLEECIKMIDIHPNFWGGQYTIGLYHWSQSDYDKAIRALKLAVKQNNSAHTLSTLGCIYGVSGIEDKAHKILSQMNEMAKKGPVASFGFAKVYAGLNEIDEALKYLDKASEERTDHLLFLDYFRRDLVPAFNDPQVLDYMRRVGIPGEQHRTKDKIH